MVTPVGRNFGVVVCEVLAAVKAWAIAKGVALPQLAQNFEFGSIFVPQCVQYDPVSANLYP